MDTGQGIGTMKKITILHSMGRPVVMLSVMLIILSLVSMLAIFTVVIGIKLSRNLNAVSENITENSSSNSDEDILQKVSDFITKEIYNISANTQDQQDVLQGIEDVKDKVNNVDNKVQNIDQKLNDLTKMKDELLSEINSAIINKNIKNGELQSLKTNLSNIKEKMLHIIQEKKEKNKLPSHTGLIQEFESQEQRIEELLKEGKDSVQNKEDSPDVADNKIVSHLKEMKVFVCNFDAMLKKEAKDLTKTTAEQSPEELRIIRQELQQNATRSWIAIVNIMRMQVLLLLHARTLGINEHSLQTEKNRLLFDVIARYTGYNHKEILELLQDKAQVNKKVFLDCLVRRIYRAQKTLVELINKDAITIVPDVSVNARTKLTRCGFRIQSNSSLDPEDIMIIFTMMSAGVEDNNLSSLSLYKLITPEVEGETEDKDEHNDTDKVFHLQELTQASFNEHFSKKGYKNNLVWGDKSVHSFSMQDMRTAPTNRSEVENNLCGNIGSNKKKSKSKYSTEISLNSVQNACSYGITTMAKVTHDHYKKKNESLGKKILAEKNNIQIGSDLMMGYNEKILQGAGMRLGMEFRDLCNVLGRKADIDYITPLEDEFYCNKVYNEYVLFEQDYHALGLSKDDALYQKPKDSLSKIALECQKENKGRVLSQMMIKNSAEDLGDCDLRKHQNNWKNFSSKIDDVHSYSSAIEQHKIKVLQKNIDANNELLKEDGDNAQDNTNTSAAVTAENDTCVLPEALQTLSQLVSMVNAR